MSYCRWSSDDFQSDVYVYGDEWGKWVTHIASRKRIFNVPLPPEVSSEHIDQYIQRHLQVDSIIKNNSKLVDINLPYAGECYFDDTPGLCADRLEMLKGLGYYVPQYAIDTLKKEEKERSDA